MTTAIAEILAERHRQVSQEGWSLEHDDQYKNGELPAAASAYAEWAAWEQQGWLGEAETFRPTSWPKEWDACWWKPVDARRNLIKAAALILAEIERLDRAAVKATQPAEPAETWSTNGEEYRFETLGELIEEGEARPGDTVYVGTTSPFTPSCFIRADHVIEYMGERAADEAGEWAEDFPNVSDAAREQLNTLLEAWADLHATVGFFLVEDAREYVITDSDLEA